MKKIQDIVDSDLCLGCGLCEAIATKEKCEMKLDLNTGFYKPVFKNKLTRRESKSILRSCPGISINGTGEKSIWGRVEKIYEAWSTDKEIREKSSSGGVITALAVHLIETGQVDGVLHIGVNADSFMFNSLKVSTHRGEIVNNCASRYAPALVFDDIVNIFNSNNNNYVFIGKPCDVSAMKNFLNEFPKYKNKIKYFFAIFCAGMPSYKGTEKLLESAKVNEEPESLKYRGDGWPGYFKVTYKQAPPFKVSYNDSWGKVLGKHLPLRCKICPDGIGLFADIAVGDSWATKDGYPDFQEQEGRSFVIARNQNGLDLLNDAIRNKKINSNDFKEDTLKFIQKYQYERRMYFGFRIIPIQLLKGFMLKYRNLNILGLMLLGNFKIGLKNAYGTFKRVKFS